MISRSVWVARSASSPTRFATGRYRTTYRPSFSTASSSVLPPRSRPGQSAATATHRLPLVGCSTSTRSWVVIGSWRSDARLGLGLGPAPVPPRPFARLAPEDARRPVGHDLVRPIARDRDAAEHLRPGERAPNPDRDLVRRPPVVEARDAFGHPRRLLGPADELPLAGTGDGDVGMREEARRAWFSARDRRVRGSDQRPNRLLVMIGDVTHRQIVRDGRSR